MIWRWIGPVSDPRGEFGGERDRVFDLRDFATRAEVCSGVVEKVEEG